MASPRAMVFPRLKLALMRNALKAGGAAVVGMVLGAVFSSLIAVTGLGGLYFLRVNPDAVEPIHQVVIVLYALVMVGWLIAPITVGQSDGILDPRILRLYPLDAPTWIIGMLVAAMVSFPALATAVVLLASPVVAGSPIGGTIAFLAGLSQLVLSVVASRVVLAGLQRIGRHRRGREVVASLAGLAAVALGGAAQLGSVTLEKLTWAQIDDLGRWLSWTPFGWAGRATAETMQGHEAAALAWLVPGLVAIPLLGWAWWRTLESTLTLAEVAPRAEHSSARRLGVLHRLPKTPMLAVMVRELRTVRRDPQGLVQFVGLLPLLVVVAMPAREVLANRDPRGMLLTSAVGLVGATTTYNLFGLDRAAVATDALVTAGYRPILVGKLLAHAVLSGSMMVLAIIGMAYWTGGWSRVPAALLIAAGGFAWSAASGLFLSARSPQPLPPPGRSPFSGSDRPGRDIVAVASRLASLVGLGIISAPIGVAVWVVRDSIPLSTMLGAIWLPLGLIVLARSVGANSRWSDTHRPELIAAMAR